MAKKKNNFKSLTLLGSEETRYDFDYNPKVLETFPNAHPEGLAWTSLICTEFTSLCPKTGQPDFARIVVNYIADKKMVESKSFKLYLFSYRNHGDFHEACIQKIADDLNFLLRPKFIEVLGEFTPRGGIAIYPYVSHSQKSFNRLREKRLETYFPGSYSMDFKRIY